MEFSKDYFKTMYPKDGYIDGDFNAREHAKYLKALLDLMEVEVKSIYDFGFGKGELLYQMAKSFFAKKVGGCDLSQFAYDNLKRKTYAKAWSLELAKVQNAKIRAVADLGLSNSVLQYIPDEEVEASVALMAAKTKFLYFHVPTSEDYKVLQKTLKFDDPYAIKRPKNFYQSIVNRYFSVVAWGLLESKENVRKNSPFADSFYRE